MTGCILRRRAPRGGPGDVMNFFKKVFAFLIVLLAVVVLWPLWPSRQFREFSLIVSVRLLLLLAVAYGTFALVDFIHDRWKKGML